MARPNWWPNCGGKLQAHTIALPGMQARQHALGKCKKKTVALRKRHRSCQRFPKSTGVPEPAQAEQ